jgi:hypothetical protein
MHENAAHERRLFFAIVSAPLEREGSQYSCLARPSRYLSNFENWQALKLVPAAHSCPGATPQQPSNPHRIFPDYPSPVVRTAEGERELIVVVRWGMPT